MQPLATASYVGADQRSSPRSDVYARVPVSLPDGRAVTATLVNISADGCLLRCEHAVEVDGVCTIALPVLGKNKARVVWSLGGRCGLQFNDAIEANDYQPMLRALGGRIGE